MSDPQDTQPLESVPAPASDSTPTPAPSPVPASIPVAEAAPTAKKGAVASICDVLKTLFCRAPKSALGWVCAGVTAFVVLCGIGIMIAFIMYGWPSMATKKLHNWEVVKDGNKAMVEVRSLNTDGKIDLLTVPVPEEIKNPKAWALERYGEQRVLELVPAKDTVLAPETDTAPVLPMVNP